MTYALSTHIRASLQASDRRIVITGAGGWLGLATLELLSEALGSDLDERIACFGASRRALALMDGRTIEQQPLDGIANLVARPSMVLHLAFLTKDRAETMSEADYRHANRALSQQVLDVLDAIDTCGVFVASSGAARFVDDPSRTDAMRLYGELKRADEEVFADWAEVRGKSAVIARLFNIAGPHINKVQSYALSAFILNALNEGIIQVKAQHRVVRGYVAIRELMSLVFALLLTDRPEVVRFDTGGAAMELGEVADTIGRQLGASVERAPIRNDREDIYSGNRGPYEVLLERHRIDAISFSEQLDDTLLSLRPRAASLNGPHPTIGGSRP